MIQYFSQAGLDKLQQELNNREHVLRPEINNQVAAALALGDLAENAEYHAAKERQSMNEGRIEEIKEILKNAVVVGPHTASDIVEIGSTILVSSSLGEKKFTIVGSSESAPAQGFISNESPLGQAFLGHKKGDEIEVRIPSGVMKYKITDVS